MEQITNVRKIRDLRKVGRKMPVKTEKQIESSRKSMTLVALTNKVSPESIEKRRQKMKGKITSPENLFKFGNKFWKLRKNTKMSEANKQLLSIIKFGKLLPHLKKYQFTSKQITKKNLEDNPKKNKFKITQEQFKEILKQFNEGKSIKKLAEKYKINEVTISKTLKRFGVNINPSERFKLYAKNNLNIQRTWFKRIKPKKVSRKELKELKKQEIRRKRIENMILNNPMKNPEIAKKVQELNNNNNLDKNGLRDKSICEMYNKGLGAEKIAKVFCLSPCTVRYVLKKNNIKSRSRKEYRGKFYAKNNSFNLLFEKEVNNENNLLINNTTVA